MIEQAIQRLKEHFAYIERLFSVSISLLTDTKTLYGTLSKESYEHLYSIAGDAETLPGHKGTRVLYGTEHYKTVLFSEMKVLSDDILLIISSIEEGVPSQDGTYPSVKVIVELLELLLIRFSSEFGNPSEGAITEIDGFQQHDLLMQLWKAGRWEYNILTEENWVDDNWKSVFGVPDHVDLSDFHTYFETYVHPEDSKKLYAVMDEFINGDLPVYHTIFRFNSEIKGMIWLEGIALITGWDGAGRPVKVVGLNRDITESYLKKIELENTNKLLGSLLEQLPSGVFWKDTDSVYLGANDIFAHDAGVDSYKDVIGKRDKDLPFVSKEYDYYREQDQKVMEARVPVMYEVNTLNDQHGQKGWSYTSKVPLIDSEDNVFGLLGVYTDITKIKRTEQQLKERDRKIQAIIDSSSDVIWTVDPAYKTEIISPSAEHLLGYSKKELKSLSIAQLLTEDSFFIIEESIRSINQELRRLSDDSDSQRQVRRQKEVTVIKQDGSTLLMDIVISPLAVDNSGHFGFLAILRDMTEQKLFEEQMRHAQRIESVSRLAGGVAHDFNNLLQVILGYSELVEDTLTKNSDEAAMLQSVIDAGYKAKSLVEQLLRFSQNTELKLRALNLHDHIKLLLPKIYPVFDADIRLVMGEQKRQPKILADAHQIEHLVLNICLNANDAMPDGGDFAIDTSEVMLSASKNVYGNKMPPGRYVCLSMKDSGVGMDQSQIENLFDPFFSTKHPSSGSGLGLSIIYGIINEHNGYIDVTSFKNSGTLIQIYFPEYIP